MTDDSYDEAGAPEAEDTMDADDALAVDTSTESLDTTNPELTDGSLGDGAGEPGDGDLADPLGPLDGPLPGTDADGDGILEATADPSLVDRSFDPDPAHGGSSGNSLGDGGFPSGTEPDPSADPSLTPDPDTIREGFDEALAADPVQALIDDTPPDVPLPITPASTPSERRNRGQFEKLVNDEAELFVQQARVAYTEAKVRGQKVTLVVWDPEDRDADPQILGDDPTDYDYFPPIDDEPPSDLPDDREPDFDDRGPDE